MYLWDCSVGGEGKLKELPCIKDVEYRKCLYREEKELLQEESWNEGRIVRDSYVCVCVHL